MYIYQGHTLFFTLRHIFKGEQLTASYLLSPKDELCNPCTHVCLCGEKNCSKTMHLTRARFEEWSKFNDKQAKETKRARIRYGTVLPLLSSYPEAIQDNPIYSMFGSSVKSPVTLGDSQSPSTVDVRKLIRKTGKTIKLPKLNKRILGVEDGIIISELL